MADKGFMKAAYPSLPLRLRIWAKDIWANSTGQDLIEYALLAAFLAVACAALMPGLAANVSKLYSIVGSTLISAKTTGS
jgi:pilus assembly protein Flp/PilA